MCPDARITRPSARRALFGGAVVILVLVAACATQQEATRIPEDIGTGSPTWLPGLPTARSAHTAAPSPTPIASPSPTEEPATVPSPTPVPYESKIGSGLRFLLSVRGTPNAPQELEEVLSQDSAAVNVTFTHELQPEEVRFIEGLGAKFDTVDDQIAHVGTIYGARIPWEKISSLAELDQVVTIESQWSPWDIPPPP